MTMCLRSILVLSAALLASTGAAYAAPPSWGLLRPGDYHGDEAPSDPGGQWLALAPHERGWQLVPAKVGATRINDSLLDEPAQKTGIRISSSLDGTVALLRSPRLKAGLLATPEMSFPGENSRFLTPLQTIDLPFKGQPQQLKVEGEKVYFIRGGQRTLLPKLTVGGPESDDVVSLLWAGDLDGDGLLDLLMEYGGSNTYGVCLFVSSDAGKGTLLRRAACHGGVGC